MVKTKEELMDRKKVIQEIMEASNGGEDVHFKDEKYAKAMDYCLKAGLMKVMGKLHKMKD